MTVRRDPFGPVTAGVISTGLSALKLNPASKPYTTIPIWYAGEIPDTKNGTDPSIWFLFPEMLYHTMSWIQLTTSRSQAWPIPSIWAILPFHGTPVRHPGQANAETPTTLASSFYKRTTDRDQNRSYNRKYAPIKDCNTLVSLGGERPKRPGRQGRLSPPTRAPARACQRRQSPYTR